MKKKILSMILVGVMAMGLLSGCGSSSDDNQASTNNSTEQSNDESGNDTSDNAAADTLSNNTDTSDNVSTDGKTLVVYYSATGTTKGVAEAIAESTGGDLFEIEPKEPYTDDDLNWSDDNSRVSREHENEDERDVELVSTTVDNWDSYDTVFIGYPIWWGIAAWPINGFVEANDFTGKTVIPFCTAASSGIGDSGNLLEEMAGTGDWVEGRRLNRGVSDTDILEWTDELGIYNN